ncbi:hypothetical protein ABW19_dt0206946 [Dactylella cylindrospora]|nr:hypothetical protein ABW19_dt0206946 [Dactylella cylindrospora]
MSEGGGAALEKANIQELAKGVFAGLLSIVTEDIVLEAHRTEKVTNMGFFSSDGVPATTQDVDSTRNDDAELASAKIMGRSLRIPIDETICHKCQHPIASTEHTSVGKKPCQRHTYRIVGGQDMYGKAVPSNSIKIAKGAFKPKVQADLDTGSRQNTPAIGEENGKPAAVKDPGSSRVPCPVCGIETSFKMWLSKHKKCLFGGAADKKGQANNGDSGSGTPLSPDSPTSSFAEGENALSAKKSKKASDNPKAPPKKAQTKKDQSGSGDAVRKDSITSAPRPEKPSATRADSPTPSATAGSQTSAPGSAGPKKKNKLLKRKADSLDDDDDKKPAIDPYDIDSHPMSTKEKESASVTPTKPIKKQKTTNTPSTSADGARVSPHPGTPTTKNLVQKFKDRTGSPTPTKKDKLGGVDMSRSQSDSAMPRKSSPKPSGLGDKDSKPKKPMKPDGSPTMKKLNPGGVSKASKKDTSGKSVPVKKKEKRPTPDRG